MLQLVLSPLNVFVSDNYQVMWKWVVVETQKFIVSIYGVKTMC